MKNTKMLTRIIFYYGPLCIHTQKLVFFPRMGQEMHYHPFILCPACNLAECCCKFKVYIRDLLPSFFFDLTDFSISENKFDHFTHMVFLKIFMHLLVVLSSSLLKNLVSVCLGFHGNTVNHLKNFISCFLLLLFVCFEREL